MNEGWLDKRGVAADWDVSGRKNGAFHAPKCFRPGSMAVLGRLNYRLSS